jgi:hypothetical protein
MEKTSKTKTMNLSTTASAKDLLGVKPSIQKALRAYLRHRLPDLLTGQNCALWLRELWNIPGSWASPEVPLARQKVKRPDSENLATSPPTAIACRARQMVR